MLKELGEFVFSTREGLAAKFGREYTREAVAGRVAGIVQGFTPRQLEVIERGPTYMPSPQVLRAMAQVLGISYGEFLAAADYLPTNEEVEAGLIANLTLEDYLRRKYKMANPHDLAKFIEGSIRGYKLIEQDDNEGTANGSDRPATLTRGDEEQAQ